VSIKFHLLTEEVIEMTSKEPKKEWSLEEELKNNKQLREEDIEAMREFCSSLPHVDISKVTGKTPAEIHIYYCLRVSNIVEISP